MARRNRAAAKNAANANADTAAPDDELPDGFKSHLSDKERKKEWKGLTGAERYALRNGRSLGEQITYTDLAQMERDGHVVIESE